MRSTAGDGRHLITRNRRPPFGRRRAPEILESDGFTIKELHLAPAGTENWGPDQCRNDPDGAVEADERLTLKDIVPGRYNVKLLDEKGRVCIVRDVEVSGGKPYAFSISEKELTDCGK